LYVQQVFVAMHALTTNVLPVTRDLCSMWRWSHGLGGFLGSVGSFIVKVVDLCCLVPMRLDHKVENIPKGYCQFDPKHVDPHDLVHGHGRYYRMLNRDRLDMAFGGVFGRKMDYHFLESTERDGKYTLTPLRNHWPFEDNGIPEQLPLWLCLLAILTVILVAQRLAIVKLLKLICGCGNKAAKTEPEGSDMEYKQLNFAVLKEDVEETGQGEELRALLKELKSLQDRVEAMEQKPSYSSRC